MGLQLGNLQSGERVNDVLLPSWANSAKHFLRLSRVALKSDYYLNAIQSEEERKRVELQANEFGIVPDQLFGKEHPLKNASWDSIDGVVLPDHPRF
ncbi:hypothetical protein HJC23_001456 [Cyclotella cryptica]|uniref:BEACH domain-containing protein n=1 Tax=Cyclotella cryptica TaxID=29204 RepID=A0ABD3PAF0_9STRA